MNIFKKLSMGAQFDLKRFRSDAEKAGVSISKKRKIEAAAENEKLNSEVEAPYDSNSDGQYDDESVESVSSDSESEVNDNIDDSNDDEEEEPEITLLGSIKAKGEAAGAAAQKKRKKKKRTANPADLLQEKVNRFRNLNNIHVFGEDIPDPVATFDQMAQEFKVNEPLMEVMTSRSYAAPTPIQMQAIPVLMHKRDVLACAPTGSGKTIAFALPLMHLLEAPKSGGFRALILEPTRELARQTCRECRLLAKSSRLGVHLVSDPKRWVQLFQNKKKKPRLDILVSTPNRLVYMLKQSPPLISLHKIEYLIIDESDKLFEEGFGAEGTGFRSQLATIYQSCTASHVTRALFSATFTHDVEKWCLLNLNNVIQVYIGGRNTASETVKQQLLFVGSEDGKFFAMRDILRKELKPPILVFVQSTDRAMQLYEQWRYHSEYRVAVIHGKMTEKERLDAVGAFHRSEVWVLICTDLLGRGIDFHQVNLVVNYDFPQSAISYIHRIGRTGRADHRGEAITFFTQKDTKVVRSIAEIIKKAGCPVPDYLLSLKKPSRSLKKKLNRRAPQRTAITSLPKDGKKPRTRREKQRAKLEKVKTKQ